MLSYGWIKLEFFFTKNKCFLNAIFIKNKFVEGRGARGRTKFCLFLDIANWKKKKLKMHTHSCTHNKASWQNCVSTCGEGRLPKFWSFHPSFPVEEFCMILCVFCQSKPPPTHKLYICVFWNNLHHLFSTLHNFTTKT